MRLLPAVAALGLLATPALAATKSEYGFFSLRNTDFVVLLAFLVFLAILLYYRVPAQVAGMLDRRAQGIRDELAQARSLRDEAQALVASFERRKGEMAAQAARIVADARADSERAAAAAREEASRAVARRLASAEEQIAAAEARAVREVRDRAVALAVAAAQEVLARQMTPQDAGRLIDQSIDTVGQRLH
jgi:F-type H+-transporting ATPase subunit b